MFYNYIQVTAKHPILKKNHYLVIFEQPKRLLNKNLPLFNHPYEKMFCLLHFQPVSQVAILFPDTGSQKWLVYKTQAKY